MGFINVGFLLCNLVTVWYTLQMEPTPTGYPARLQNNLCDVHAEYL
jgi:hypothetical protein